MTFDAILYNKYKDTYALYVTFFLLSWFVIARAVFLILVNTSEKAKMNYVRLRQKIAT